VYCHDTREGKTSTWHRTKVPSDPSLIAVEEVVYPSKDGTLVPLLLAVGGDEFTGGVPDPRAHLADLIAQGKFISLTRQLMAWSLVKRRPWVQLL
jgi:hypothetical protein